METQNQAKEKIVNALLALRNILTQGPLERYPFPNNIGDQHPEIAERVSEIKRELTPHQAVLDPHPPYFRDFLNCDVLTLNKLPADWETIQWLDQYIVEFGGKVPTDNDPKKKRRGRKKADYETVKREAELADKWKQAHEAGICKVDFAKDINMGPKELDKLLNRVYKREKRSDK